MFGGCFILLFGEFGQLPLVVDLPLCTTVNRSDLSDQGQRAYQKFEKTFTVTQVMCQSGEDPEQICFCDILILLL